MHFDPPPGHDEPLRRALTERYSEDENLVVRELLRQLQVSPEAQQ